MQDTLNCSDTESARVGERYFLKRNPHCSQENERKLMFVSKKQQIPTNFLVQTTKPIIGVYTHTHTLLEELSLKISIFCDAMRQIFLYYFERQGKHYPVHKHLMFFSFQSFSECLSLHHYSGKEESIMLIFQMRKAKQKD